MKINILLVVALLLLSLIADGQTIPSYIPTDSLVAWYPFNGNVNDESGNGNNGIKGGSFKLIETTDRFGAGKSAFYFNGKVFIHGDCSAFPKNDRTISAWYLPDSLGYSSFRQLLFGYGGSPCGKSWLMNFENPDLPVSPVGKFEVQGHCLAFRTYVQYPDWKTNWTHVAVTYSDTTLKFYFNGKLVRTAVIDSTETTVEDKKWGIASYPSNDGETMYDENSLGDHLFRGKIDDIAIWGRVLDSSEISSLYNSGNTSSMVDLEPSLITLYPNPFHNELYLEIPSQLIGSKFSLVGIDGRLWQDGILSAQQIELDASQFPPGVYFLHIMGKKSKTLRLIKH